MKQPSTTQEHTAQLLFDKFKGNRRAYAVLRGHWQPVDVGYTEWTHILPHVQHSLPCGVYLLEGSKCYSSCIDVDNHIGKVTGERENPGWREDTEALVEACGQLLSQAEPLVEVSQSGEGAHIWLRSEQGLEARAIRAFWQKVGKKAGMALKEVFPKQDQQGKKGYGNLVRYPLWGQSKFVDVWNCWEPLEAVEAMEGFCSIEDRDILSVVGELKPGRPQGIPGASPGLSPAVELLVSDPTKKASLRWNLDPSGLTDTSFSAIRLSFIGSLHAWGVPAYEIIPAVRALELKAGHAPCPDALLAEEIQRSINNAAKGGYSAAHFQLLKNQEQSSPQVIQKAARAVKTLAQAEKQEIQWLWQNRIPEGQTTILYGQSGSYKTWFSLECARRVTSGLPWPDGSEAPTGDVLFLTSEDTDSTIRQRAELIGLPLDRVKFLDTTEVPVTFFDLEELLGAEGMEDVRLVIIDPCDGHLGDGRDTNNAADVRRALESVRQCLTGRSNLVGEPDLNSGEESYTNMSKPITLLAIHHTNKGQDNTLLQKAAGSRAWVNVPRTCVHLQSNRSELKPRITLSWAKANLAEGVPGTVEAFFGAHGFEYTTFNKELENGELE